MLALSVAQLVASLVIVVLAIAITYAIGLDEGKYRGRRQGLLYARELGEKRFNEEARELRALRGRQ
jgi:hypothetical protein